MKSILGLDIGSHTIKLIELQNDHGALTLLAAGSTHTPPKAVSSNINADSEAVAVVIKQLIRDSGAKSSDVCIALPESQVFTRVLEVPQLSQKELTSAIKWEAEQYIPLPLDQVNTDFTILRDGKAGGKNIMEVLLVACPKALLEKYLMILEFAELTPIAAETEIIALSRSLVRSLTSIKTAMVVQMGATTTDLAIVHNGIISFTRSMSAGGEALTRSIAQTLDFNISQAEEYKRAYGLENDKLEGKIVAAAKPIMDTITNEMRRAIAFYQEKHPDEPIETILLGGGTSKVPGMVVAIAEATNIETQVANPWVGISKDQRFNVLGPEGPIFGVAVGLALRE